MHQGDCPLFSIVALPTTSFVVAPVVRSTKEKKIRSLWLKAVSVQDTCNGQVSGTLLRGRGVS